MKKDDSVYLENIIVYINKVDSYIKNKTIDSFLASEEYQNNVIRMLEIIGEASIKLSSELKSNYPEVPWNKMRATRNILVHDYGSVRIDVIWNTARTAMIPLKKQILNIMKDVSPQLFIDYKDNDND